MAFDGLWHSFGLVALTEMGDKTQLLALVLTTRFRQPWAILGGILVATIANHLLASATGAWVAGFFAPEVLRWTLAVLFFAFAAWVLIPDKDDDKEPSDRFGAFLTTAILFFLAEIGDKTQLATVALAAKYQNVVMVTAGTTLGMMFSDGLAVAFGERLTRIIPMKWIRYVAAGLFVLFGVAVIVATG